MSNNVKKNSKEELFYNHKKCVLLLDYIIKTQTDLYSLLYKKLV